MSVTNSYVVTNTTIRKDGVKIFIPVIDVEVFFSYITALRYLADVKRAFKEIGSTVTQHFQKYHNNYGRETLGSLHIYRKGVYDKFVITRIPIMDK